MKELKVGVVGLGVMGDVHSRVYKSLPGVTLVGAVEAVPETAKKFADAHGVKIFASVDELLPQVDAISVCTPDNMHKDIILKALKRGVKCLVEKPLEVTTKDCQEIIAAMPDETYVMVGHILRFDPRVWCAKQILDKGEIGKVHSVNIWRSNSRLSGERIGKRTSITWFLGIHDIDLVLWLTGCDVTRINAMGKKIFTKYYDYVVSTMELSNGAIAVMENGWTMPAERVTGLDAGIKIIGETGMIEINLTHNDARVTSGERRRSMLMDTYHWPSIGPDLYGGLRAEIDSFVQCVRNNKVPPVTAREAMKAVDVVERIEKVLDGKA